MKGACKTFHLMKFRTALWHLELVHKLHTDADFGLPTGVFKVSEMTYGQLWALHKAICDGLYETVERGPN